MSKFTPSSALPSCYLTSCLSFFAEKAKIDFKESLRTILETQARPEPGQLSSSDVSSFGQGDWDILLKDCLSRDQQLIIFLACRRLIDFPCQCLMIVFDIAGTLSNRIVSAPKPKLATTVPGKDSLSLLDLSEGSTCTSSLFRPKENNHKKRLSEE